jgi:putative transposase
VLVSINPVRAGLVERAEEWRCSSVASHLSAQDNELVKVAPVLDRYGDFATFLAQEDVTEAFKRLVSRKQRDDLWARRIGSKS